MTQVKKKAVHWADEGGNKNSELVRILGPLLVPASEMTDHEIASLWYTEHEARVQKAMARRVAQHVGKNAEYTKVMTNLYASCVTGTEPSKLDFSKLVQWNNKTLSSRGLERYVVDSVTRPRMESKVDLIQAIIEAQGADKVEALCRISLEKSQEARKFAQIMGLADALAVHQAKTIPSRQGCVGPRENFVSSSTSCAA
jgi:hypothetical protein